MSTKPIMIKGKMVMIKGKIVGFIQTYVPEGWETRREYDSEDRAMAAESLLPKSPVQAVYLLYREISDQMGTSEVIGVYSSSDQAHMQGEMIKDRRTFIKPMMLDSVPRK